MRTTVPYVSSPMDFEVNIEEKDIENERRISEDFSDSRERMKDRQECKVVKRIELNIYRQ